jgi:hypothetical protein
LANTLSRIRFGRYSTTSENTSSSGVQLLGANGGWATVFDAASQNVWVVTYGGVVGKATGTTPTVRWTSYTVNSSGVPNTRTGYSATASASTAFSTYNGGALVTAAVSHSDNGPANTGVMVFSGQKYAIEADATVATLGLSVAPGSAYAFIRGSLSSPPASSFGSTYSHDANAGSLTAYMEGWANVAPETPSSGLAPSGTINETAPTFTADFRDKNGAYGASSTLGVDTGDQLNQYQIQVRRVSDQTIFWDTTLNAGSVQKANNQASYPYGGTTLVRGTAYEWRIRMSDQFSAWSNWSSWTAFTPANLGFITLDSTPTGKQEAVSGIDFKGRWTHQSSTSMKTVQVRLLDQNGTILQTGANYDIADVSSSAAPGTLFTVTWANTGFSALGWGRSYQYQMRGYDGSQWSDWSAARSFTTNAAPTVPVLSSPTGGIVLTAYPKLAASFTDADDTTATGLTGVFRITRPNATTVDVTPTYNSTSGKWEYQTTSTQLSAYGVYSWKATGYDGTLYSGEASTLTAATWSSSATFDYETGPAVTVTSPSDGATITTASLNVAWTVTGQVKYQVRLYEDGGSTIVYDSGLITSATTSHTIPSGYLRNGESYDLTVSVTDSTPLTGTSSIVNIDVAFTAPTAVANLSASVYNDASIRVSWDQTSYSSPEFSEYTLSRWADGGPDAAPIVLARLTSPTDVAFIDDAPASGYEYTYGVTVVTVTGVDVLESDQVTASATVTLAATVLSLLGNGQTYRVVLPNVTERSHDRQLQEAVYTSLAGGKPTTIRSKVRYWQSSFTAFVAASSDQTAARIVDAFDALDAQNGTVVYRDARQRKRFCVITDWSVTDHQPGTFFEIAFALRETSAQEGEA